jgi:hypothetical protein
MKLKLLAFFCAVLTLSSCQFTETMVLNEDGSGALSVEANLNEMMAFGGQAMADSMPMKLDTLIVMRQFLEAKKDSIATLSKEQQEKLKKMENFNIHLQMDSEAGVMVYDVATQFKNVAEANDILNHLELAGSIIPDPSGKTEVKKEEDAPEIIGVNYSFNNGIFKRNAYIKDPALHQKEVDSLQQAAAFMGGSNYTLKYTFPKKITKASNPNATYSLDGKTITVQQPFLEYFKNPDLLDLEITLEK